jgi:predicted acylesterase/phospholipase RssA
LNHELQSEDSLKDPNMLSLPNRSPGLKSVLVWFVCVALFLAPGCATLRPRNTLPEYQEAKVEIPGMPGVRAWGDEVSEVFTEFTLKSAQQERAAYGEAVAKKPVSFLALSGGGDDGAFGAGVLCGWTDHGDRPKFKMVTGISTGALIAPFAFLGSRYDNVLRHVYTGVTSDDIFRRKSLLTVLWRESLADTRPLARLLDIYVDDAMLAEVAREHQRGRRLIIGTTQLDAQRLVLWDMGAIAASGDPEAIKLFRKVMLASASIPAAFPPQYIKVEAGGKIYEEMHVDGGTTAQVILYEAALDPDAMIAGMDQLSRGRPRILYIIRNSQVKPEWEDVRPRLVPIAGRAISTLIKYHGVGDLFRLYAFAKRDKMDYNVAAIPDTAPSHPGELFNQAYMNQLFELGYDLAVKGYPWMKYPPLFNPTPVFKKPTKIKPITLETGEN